MDINNPEQFLTQFRTFENKMCWHINDLCNFKCEYCFFPYLDKENPDAGRLSPDQILDAFNKTGRKWHLFIAGGEPLLYPDFNTLVNTLKPHHPIQISTNLYNKNVKPFANEVSPDNIIVINASLHIGHHSEKSLLQFIKNYHLFVDKGFNMLVSYVTYPPLLHRIKDDFKFLRERGIKQIIPLTYHGNFEGKRYPPSYTREQQQIIYDLSSALPLERLNTLDKMKFKNQHCRAGKDFFFMHVNGNVFNCGTILKPYGNLFDGTFKPDSQMMRCTAETCNDNWLGILSLKKEPTPPEMESELFYNIKEHYNTLKEVFSF